jgi:hypothetical protein
MPSKRVVPSGLVSVIVAILSLSALVNGQGEARVVPGAQGTNLIIVDTHVGTVTVRESEFPVIDLVLRAVPASPVLLCTWSEVGDGGPTPFYAISLDGQRFHEATPTSYELKLRYGHFDPAIAQPRVPPHLNANSGGNLWIVQYWSQGLEEYRNHLAELGADVHMHLWNHANVVRMDSRLAASVKQLPFVRAVTSFHPAYKLDETLLQEQVQGWAPQPVKRVNIASLRRGLVDQEPIAQRIRDLGGEVHQLDAHTYQMRVTLDLAQINAIAQMDEVQWIEVEGPGRDTMDMDIARQFHGSLHVFNMAGFNGTGVRGEVCDAGTQVNHPEFLTRPLIQHGGLGSNSHGTSTYGQIFAQGNDPQALGICYMGQGIANQYPSWSGGTEYIHTTELSNPGLNYQAVFQTFSGFSPLTLNYTTDSQTSDLILLDSPRLTVTQSQSNTGNRNSRARAWSKNVVAIGGVAHGNSLSYADDSWTSASIGPAADGRVKPELASFYDNIYTTTTTSAYTSGFGGTSGATPIVAGHFGIFYEMWHNGVFNNPTGSTVFDSRPQSTLARAMIIASATQWDFVNGTAANSDIDRDKQGWGHPNLMTLYDYRNKLLYVNEEDVLTNLSSTVHNVTVSPGEPIFKATLVWRDNPGTISSSQHLINNLDLRVTSPSGLTYWGNNGMTNDAAGGAGEVLWTVPGGAPDTLNSVENVFVQNPQTGVWRVEVIAANINQDNHAETPVLDADYALCVIGVVQAPPTFFNLDLSTTGAGDLSIDLQNVPMGTTQGYMLFSEDASGIQGGGPLLGLYPTGITFFSFTQPLTPGNLFHWTWPVSGLFPDTPVNFPVGALPLSLFPVDGIAIAIDGSFNLSTTSVRRAQ